MAEPKTKIEAYNLLGGINIKASKYVTAPTEFLDIQNMNFGRPNSLVSRAGVTNYCGIDGNPAGTSLGLITGLHEYVELAGFSMIVMAGMSTMIGYGGFGVTTLDPNIRTIPGLPIPLMDMETFVDRLFYCNGQIMRKFSSISGEEFYTLPPGLTLSVLGVNGVTSYIQAPSSTGVFGFAYGYLNDRGYLGPAINYFSISLSSGLGVRLQGITVPSGYGITGIAFYMTDPNLTAFYPVPDAIFPVGVTFVYITQTYFPQVLPLGGYTAYMPDTINSLTLTGVALPLGVQAGITNPPLGAPSGGGNGWSLTPIGLTTGMQSTGIFGFAYNYLSDLGGFGPLSTPLSVSLSNNLNPLMQGMTGINLNGITAIALYMTPPGNGLTAISFNNGATTLVGVTFPCVIGFPGLSLYLLPFGSTLFQGVGVNPLLPLNAGGFGNPIYIQASVPYTDLVVPVVGGNLQLGLQPAPQALFFTLVPKYIEIFQNSMFLSGISGQLSNVYFSDPGEPESVQPTNFFEVRTNDGDRVTGMKAYGAKMVISKRKSLHLLTGSSAENYYLREISTEYGCLSHRALAVFEDTLLFLDEKGIAIFDGQSCRIMSNKIEAVFKNMNVAAAIDNAVAVHNRPENQVIFAFPSNGNPYSTGAGSVGFNDTIVVYDYLVNAWTVYYNLYPSALMIGKGQFVNDTLFTAIFGQASTRLDPYPFGYTGFGPFLQFSSSSLATDLFSFGRILNANAIGAISIIGTAGGLSQIIMGISCSWTSPFSNPFGHSVEAQFRRLYSDFDVAGSTILCNIGLFADFGYSPGAGSVPYGATFYGIYLNQFQTRIDFGIPAKSMAVQWNATSSSGTPIAFNGYSVEARLQRMV